MTPRDSGPAGTTDTRERYVQLSPMSVEQEIALTLWARAFFSPANYAKNCQAIGKAPASRSITPMSGRDFMDYLKTTRLLEDPNRYIYHIRDLLGRMAANNILVEMPSRDSSFVMIPKSYYALSEVSTMRSAGVLWMAKTLGGRFIHHQIARAIVQIAGQSAEGDARAGSGVVFDPYHILTCRHVVSDMSINRTQNLQGNQVIVEHKAILKHGSLDVAVLRVREPLRTVPGLAFLAPFVTQRVYTFGYPRVPCALPGRSDSSPLIVQGGEVTSDSISVIGGGDLVLYSAISRPGNSGGAIVSDDGYVVGITTELAEGQYSGEGPFSPHYAGIPAQILARAVDEMDLGIRFPYETFD